MMIFCYCLQSIIDGISCVRRNGRINGFHFPKYWVLSFLFDNVGGLINIHWNDYIIEFKESALCITWPISAYLLNKIIVLWLDGRHALLDFCCGCWGYKYIYKLDVIKSPNCLHGLYLPEVKRCCTWRPFWKSDIDIGHILKIKKVIQLRNIHAKFGSSWLNIHQ